jgi:hypothetical protein
MKNKQIIDQAAKGGILGVATWIAFSAGVDESVIAVLIPVATTILAWASSKFGDKAIASFFGSAPVKEIVREVVKIIEKEVAPAAKAPAKPAAKRGRPKKSS